MKNSICNDKFTTITVGGHVYTWLTGHEPAWVKHMAEAQEAERAIMDAHNREWLDGDFASSELITNEYAGLLADMSARRIVDAVTDDILMFCD